VVDGVPGLRPLAASPPTHAAAGVGPRTAARIVARAAACIVPPRIPLLEPLRATHLPTISAELRL